MKKRKASGKRRAVAAKPAAGPKKKVKPGATKAATRPRAAGANAAAKPATPLTSTGYWLFKTEPEAFSIADLDRATGKTAFWDGVRNYQARNFLRDTVRPGDQVLIYHSNAEPTGIAGTAVVVRAGYPDHTAFEPGHVHFDPDSRRDAPAWFMVDVRHDRTFPRVVTREELAADPITRGMGVLRRANRLSIQPVSAEEWGAVVRLAGK